MRLRPLMSIIIVLGLMWPALSRASEIQLAPKPAQRALAVIRGPEGLRLLLSKIAINGIGMSGRQEAEPILLELLRHPYSPNQLGNVSDALKAHRRLVKVGRSAFYGPPEAPSGNR